MKKIILCFLGGILSATSCIEPDQFGPEGSYVAETHVIAKAPTFTSLNSELTPIHLKWREKDSVDIYYVPTKSWTTYSPVQFVSSDEGQFAEFSAWQEWMYGRRSHIFYALAPSQNLMEISETDPAELNLELSSVQKVSEGVEKYMISSALTVVKEASEDKRMEMDLTPALALLKLGMTATSAMYLKTLTLTPVGTGLGKGLTGPYKLDVATTSINMRTSNNSSVTLDFGEGLKMEPSEEYVEYAVVLPAKLDGYKLSISGTTQEGALDPSVCDAIDMKQGIVNELSLSLSPGPIRQEYEFEVTSGALGEEANNKRLIYLGAHKTQQTDIRGIKIGKSLVNLEYEEGESKIEDAFWVASAPDWIILSQTSGKGAADIDVMVLPNLPKLKNDRIESIQDLSTEGTANTYMVHAPGTYRFKANVMGNGNVLPDANFTDYAGSPLSSASLNGGASANVLWQECVDQIVDVEYDGSYIEFTTSDYVVPGNAVIALYNGAGQIMWSWQVWFTDELNNDDLIVNANTNPEAISQGLNLFYMMDRNLGAMCQLDSDAARFPQKREGEITIIQYTDESQTVPTGKSYSIPVYQHGVASNSYYKPLCYCGMRYQWGRKDPFVTPYVSSNWPSFMFFDGENREFASLATENGGFGKGYNVTIASGIAKPNVYFKSNGTTDWMEEHNYDLWGNGNGHVQDPETAARPYGVKTIYDPCPVGYMVPTIDAFSSFTVGTIVGGFANGYYFRADDSDSEGVFFPAGGEMNSSGVSASVGASGFYYTGSIDRASNNSYQLQVQNGNVNNYFNTGHGNGRTIRCVRERN